MRQRRTPPTSRSSGADPPASPLIDGAISPARARRQDIVIFLAITAIALALRLIYIEYLRDSPLFRHPELDELYHDQWAQAIVRGERFIDGPYFRAPLYPAFLAGIYAMFGHSYLVPRLIQALLGSLSCGLLFVVGRDVSSRAVGIVAGLAAATYGTLIYFDGELLIPPLIVFLDVLLIWLLVRGAIQPSITRFGSAGVVLGLSAIARPNILLFAPAVVFWVLQRNGVRSRRSWIFAACFTVGASAVIAPVALRNLIVGRDYVLIASQGGVNFYIGNNPDSNGMVAAIPGMPADWWGGYRASIARAEQARGRKLKPSEVSRYYYEQAWDFMRSQPASAIALTLRKLHLFWIRGEISNNKGIEFWTKRFTPWLLYLPLGFGVVGPLGITGLVLCRRRASLLFPLWGFVLVYMASVVAFFCTARFRMPVVPILILLATDTCFWIAGAARRRERKALLGVVILTLLATGFVWTGSDREVLSNRALSYQMLAKAYEADGQFALAIVNFRQAMRFDREPKNPDIPNRLSYLLARTGRFEQAEQACREALRIDPRHPKANDNLGNLLSRTGRLEEAASRFDVAIRADPRYANAHYGKGLNLLRQGKTRQAGEELQACLRLDPNHAAALNNLGNLLATQGQLSQAEDHFRRALHIDSTSPELHNNLANVLRDMRHYTEATDHYRIALQLNPSYAKAHQNLGELLVRTGRPKAALPHWYESVRLHPNDAPLLLKLAWLLATDPHDELRNGRDAVRFAQKARRLFGDEHPRALDVLAAAYAETGDFTKAREIAKRALEQTTAQEPPRWAKDIRARLRLYEAARPYRRIP